jgi:hypothetical protein
MPRRAFLAGIVLGALIRAATCPLPGTGDVTVWKIWAHAASRDGVLQMYGVGGAPPERRVHEYDGRIATVDYPPLSLLALGAAGHVYRIVSGGFANTAALTAVVKILPLFADIGITWLLWFAVRRVSPAKPDLSRLAALAYWVNPAVLMNGAVLGYLDPLLGLPVMAALVAAALSRPWLAGTCLALAVLTKPQAVLLAPLVALAIVNTAPAGRRARALCGAAAAGTAVFAATLLPFAIAGAWPNFLQSMESLGRHNSLSAQAANPWWLVTYVMRAAYAVNELGWYDAFLQPVQRPLMVTRVVELGYPSPRLLAALLVTAAMAWGLWKGRAARQLGDLAAVGGWIVFAYFMFGMAVHENHGYLLVPLLAVAAALRPGWTPLAAWLSATMALNLNVFYGFGDRVGWAIPRGLTPPDLTVWLALLHAALFVAYGRRLARTTPAPT